MPNSNPSPNMGMPIPVIGQEPGPQYASDVNVSLGIVDQHDHSSGSGVLVTPAGLNINTDLPVNDNNLVTIRSARFSPQSAPLGLVTDLGCLYESGVDLWFNDGVGNQVRITQSGGVAGSPGSISNLTSPASASYVSANQTFVWQSDANTPANMDFASAIFRNLTANSKGLTLNPPPTMASDFSLQLPTIPVQTNLMTLNTSGVMAGNANVDNTSLQFTSNTLSIKNLGVGTVQLAAQAVTAPKLASGVLQPVQTAITSSGTFTVPTGVTQIFIQACGGGGSGGTGGSPGTSATNAGGGGGGGGGAPIMQTWAIVTPGDAIVVTIGAGGNAVNNTVSDNNGSAGVATTLLGPSVDLTCPGGAGGGHGGATSANGVAGNNSELSAGGSGGAVNATESGGGGGGAGDRSGGAGGVGGSIGSDGFWQGGGGGGGGTTAGTNVHGGAGGRSILTALQSSGGTSSGTNAGGGGGGGGSAFGVGGNGGNGDALAGNGHDAAANTGAGGGGCGARTGNSSSTATSGAGGSGKVVITYWPST